MTDALVPSVSAPQLESTELALLRTRAALDRTLLAWVRTALALEGFGFTLATYVAKWIESGAIHDVRPTLPHTLGLTLLGMGILAMLGGSIEHERALQKLGKLSYGLRSSLVLVLAVLTGTLRRSRVFTTWVTSGLTVRSGDGPLRLARDGETFDGTDDVVIAKDDARLAVFTPRRDDW